MLIARPNQNCTHQSFFHPSFLLSFSPLIVSSPSSSIFLPSLLPSCARYFPRSSPFSCSSPCFLLFLFCSSTSFLYFFLPFPCFIPPFPPAFLQLSSCFPPLLLPSFFLYSLSSHSLLLPLRFLFITTSCYFSSFLPYCCCWNWCWKEGKLPLNFFSFTSRLSFVLSFLVSFIIFFFNSSFLVFPLLTRFYLPLFLSPRLSTPHSFHPLLLLFAFLICWHFIISNKQYFSLCIPPSLCDYAFVFFPQISSLLFFSLPSFLPSLLSSALSSYFLSLSPSFEGRNWFDH